MGSKRNKRKTRKTPATPPSRLPAADRWQAPPRVLFGAAALAVMIVTVYFPALTGEPLWDDVIWLTEPLVLSWSGIRDIWLAPSALSQEAHYWPLVYTSFWLEHKLWGLTPVGYHLSNVLLHLVNTLLVWRLLVVLRVPGAWAAAAIFAVHPLHVESVAWIIERKDLLSTLFYLCAVLVWIRPQGPRPVLAAVLLTAALLSKSMPATLPVALLLWYWWRGRWPSLRETAGLAALFGVSLFITLADVAFYVSRESLSLGYSFIERVQIASHALWFYVGKLLWPTNLAVIYPHWEIGAANAGAWLYVIAAAVAAALLWFSRRRIGRAPVVAVAFFTLTLAPALGFIDYGYMQFSFVADRFQYLAGLGVIAGLAGSAAFLAARYRYGEKIAQAALAIVLAAFGTLSWNQASIYRNDMVFFEHVIEHNPLARGAHGNLAIEYFKVGRLEEGLEINLIAAEQDPESAGTQSNLGQAYLRLERFQEAEEAFSRALELDPRSLDARQNYGEVLREQGKHQAAATQYREAISIDSDFAIGYAALGQSLFHLGRNAEAVEAIDRAIDLGLEPATGQILNLIAAQALGRLGRMAEAEERIAATAAEAPGNVRPAAYRVALQLEAGQAAAAERSFRAALDLYAGNASDLYDFGQALTSLAAQQYALGAYRAALAVDPDHVRALVEVGNLELDFDRFAESLTAFDRALALSPDLAEQAALHGSMGEAALELGQDDAADYFERALAVDPRDYSSLDRLAMVRFNQERYQEALSLYNTMLEQQPDNHTVLTNLGLTLYRLERIGEARVSLESALVLAPEHELARALLGQIEQDLAETPSQNQN